MTRLPDRRANRRQTLYQDRIKAATTEKTLMFVIVGWLLGEYYAATPERRAALRHRMTRLAKEMNEEARR